MQCYKYSTMYLHYYHFVHISYHFVVPYIITKTLPPLPIQGAMVGSPQDIQCIVSTVSGVELSSVMISWMGPEGESITNASRVTISPTTSSGNNYTSSLQFTYLMEGDEGMYTCNVMILEATAIVSVEIFNLSGKQEHVFNNIIYRNIPYILCIYNMNRIDLPYMVIFQTKHKLLIPYTSKHSRGKIFAVHQRCA